MSMYQAFLDDIEAQGLTIAEAFGIPDATENMVMFDARLTLIRDEAVIAARLRPGTGRRRCRPLLATSPELLTTVCARHILSPDRGRRTGSHRPSRAR